MEDDVLSAASPQSAAGTSQSRTGAGAIARRPKKVERSCILCHRRKIKCDKKSPCATCTRTGVLCCYPTSEQPVRRPRKTTIADVAERLVRLERTLVAISSSDVPTEAGMDTPSESTGVRGPDHRTGGDKGQSVTQGFLLHNGDSSRYMNEILISRVLEEEDELRSVLSAQETVRHDLQADPDSDRFQPFDLSGLLSGYSPPAVSSVDHHPPKWPAMQLWQIFVNHVDLFHKVLHVPTTQIVVYKAIDDPASAPADVVCLLFAVYFSAVTATEEETVVSLLGQSKRRALSVFRRGLEIALVQADFLEEPTLTSVQAMAIFLQTTRAHNTGRSVWVLGGLVLRAAQSMGLHRDGKSLGLSIFETELRRRLWWGLAGHDGRVAEDQSMAINAYDPETNISFPSNVDDSQLYPGMTELIETPGRWTEMSLSLIMKEHCLARKHLYQAIPPHSNAVPTEAARREIMDRLFAHCEKEYFQYCNTIIPAQRASMLIGRAVVSKLDFVSRLQWLSLSNRDTTRGLASDDETLAEACQVLDYGTQLQSDELLRNYRWVVEVYPQYHVLLHVLWRLCVRPTGPGVERAWRHVDRAFDLEFGRLGFENSPPGSKWTVLKALREKALKIRQLMAEGKTTGSGKGTSVEASGSTAAVETHGVGDFEADVIGSGFTWNPDDEHLPDWNELADNLKLDGFDIQI